MARYSQRRIQEYIEQSDNADTADAKGNILEELARYIFEKVPGISFYKKNILDGRRAHEIDVVFWNPQNVSELCFLDAILITECKNLARPVGSADIGWFVRKLQDRGATCALLISLSDITGSQNGVSSAHSEVLSALVRDRIKLIILTRQEILALCETKNLVELIREKMLKLTLEKIVYISGHES